MVDEFLKTFGYIAVLIIGLSVIGFGLKILIDNLKVHVDNKNIESHHRASAAMKYGGTEGSFSKVPGREK